MTIIPISDSLILPNTTIQLNKEVLDAVINDTVKPNDHVVLLLRKEEGQNGRFYPIGFLGNVVMASEDSEEITIEVTDSIHVQEVDLQNAHVEYSLRTEVVDVDDTEAQIQLEELKKQIEKVAAKFMGNSLVPQMYLQPMDTWNKLAVHYTPYINLSQEDKYEIMKAETTSEKIRLVTKVIQEALTMMELSREAQTDNNESYKKLYRESALKKQIQYLQKQLDDMHPEDKSQVQIFEEKIEASGMNETAKKEALKVLNRLKTEGQDGHESGMLYDYLDFVTGLDWKKRSIDVVDLNQAQEILDSEHYGLKKVKQRIIEQMAVMSLSKKQSGSILLFVGAPGTGKTSIAHSIAEALGREYIRISLGGVRDEADIRGHRRTYIGAMPGRVMDGMKKSGASNPVMVLDEIDKLSTSYNGDPASALLEVLDPEQNHTFTDHYMNVPYDLSDVMFICTANSLDTIPGPLLDRMEVIQFNGYTPLEKLQIGKRHLLKKAMEKNGIGEQDLVVTDEAMEHIISGYTMEGGVRGLKKQLDKLARFAAVKLVQGDQAQVEVTTENLAEFMDQKEIHHEKVLETKEAGIVTGLAWTAVGGEILFIETMLTKGEGKVLITGQLGDVMKESAQIAISLVKKMYPDKAELFQKNDLHIHVPAGATPKDGPSAGITLTTALASLVNEKPVSPEVGMTGEVSLRGNVMPIGGLPEKLMAAQRAGVKRVFIPKENEYDLKDVAPEVLEALTVIPVERVEDVLGAVL